MTDELRDVSHTPPHEDRNRVQDYYERGPSAVADGGERADDERVDAGVDDEPTADDEATEGEAPEDATLKDVDHTPPDGEGVNNVYRRGEKRE